MNTCKAVYTGEMSGVVISDLDHIEVKRGRPFDCPETWLTARMKLEPTRWRKASAGEIDAENLRVKAEQQAAAKAAEEE